MANGPFDDTISQSINAAPNCRFAVSYYLTASATGRFFPAANGQALRDSTGASLEIDPTNPCANHGTNTQTLYTGYFVATSFTATLSFAGRDQIGYFDLQGITVVRQ